MSVALAAGTPPISLHDEPSEYRAGACNIGRDEINRRWRFGHGALISAVVLFVVLVAIGAPPVVRAIVGIPAAVAAACYIEAYLRFCIRFGWLGLFNFGSRGTVQHVADRAARATDRRRSVWLSTVCAAVLVAVAVIAVVLPI